MKVWKFRGTWRSRQGLVGLDGRPCRRRRFPAALHAHGRHALFGQRMTVGPTSLFLWAESPRFSSRPAAVGPDGRPVGAKGSIEKIVPSEITLIYRDVKLNAKLRAGRICLSCPCVGQRR